MSVAAGGVTSSMPYYYNEATPTREARSQEEVTSTDDLVRNGLHAESLQESDIISMTRDSGKKAIPQVDASTHEVEEKPSDPVTMTSQVRLLYSPE